ncbi:hemoglobin-like oxygen-binding protein [Alteromonas aestuariivivens]|uniref:Hemoglobin-like oxygen-binding protein n=1 Tax=Alteromonas aestuariivivens TaxID=1938339 RepID=A0A3D8M4Y1_9ALTE|nr:group II truncated hemoglobin [Alteromonas aestuariivivens]RDV24749.1 hemoglobin-like oxygen-binding protein [Alteromonas aestuariivivens]
MNVFDFLAEKLKQNKRATTPYEAIGGEKTVRRIADRFYTIMEQDPLASQLYAIHPKPLDRIRHVFFLYLSMWLGGPNDYEVSRGHPRLRARHLPYKVTPLLKNQWMYCMRKALLENVSDLALAEQLLRSLDQLAEHMVNSQ